MIRFEDLVDPADLKAALDAKLINVRESQDGLLIYSYSKLAPITPGAWDNPAVRICRGVIVNPSTGEVVARPYEKFFNYNQDEAGVLSLANAPVEVTDKVDGSLGILYYDTTGTPRVATRGSFDSDQAKRATTLLNYDYGFHLPGWRYWHVDFTPLLEIVYPENRIVVNYGDDERLVLLGGVWNDTGRKVGPVEAAEIIDFYSLGLGEWLSADTVEVFQYRTLAQALAAEPRRNAEGLVVRYLDDEGKMVKIKQEDYVNLHRIVTGMSEQKVWERFCEGGYLRDLLADLPDEMHPWVTEVWEGLEAEFWGLYWAAVNAYGEAKDALCAAHPDGWTRKDFAQRVADYPELARYLFAMLDGKKIGPMILKAIKPKGETQYRFIPEGAA